MNINFDFIWKMYKQNPDKQQLIKRFENASTALEFAEFFKDFNPEYINKDNTEYNVSMINMWWALVDSDFLTVDIDSMDKAAEVYEDIISINIVRGLIQNDEKSINAYYRDVIKEFSYFYHSINLYRIAPEFYLPFFYLDGLYTLKKIAIAFDFELPKVPVQKNMKARLMYYMELCKCFKAFREEHNLSPAEMCAFLYDFAPEYVKEDETADLPTPEQAWFIGGDRADMGDKVYWGIKQDVRRGDIVVFYEMAPVKSITAVCRALSDGALEPFFEWYSLALIGKRTDTPAISLDELRKDEYFKDNSFVRRNFQGMSKCPMMPADYNRIVELIRSKGFDGDLPELYEPINIQNVEIACEQDVSDKLLIPRLEEMGWKYKVDFYDEVQFPAGRGTTGYQMKKRVDFALHLTGSDKDRGAKVIIEAKEHMVGVDGIEANFYQGLSYAKYADAKVLVTCDKFQFRIYTRTKHNNFDLNHYKRYRWSDFNKLETFHEIKEILSVM